MNRWRLRRIALSVLLLGAFLLAQAQGSAAFSVQVPADFAGELNGRALVIVTDNLDREPYLQQGVTGAPVFGKTVRGLTAGDTISFTAADSDVYGYPFQLADIPAKTLYAQAFFIVHTRYDRAAGPAIYGMEDHGGGGRFTRNPYNLFSQALEVDFSSVSEPVELVLDQAIPLGYELQEGQVTQQGNYEDTGQVKFVKIKSELLSAFWGQDMYLGANVLLPRDYDPQKRYGTLYHQGHWPGGNAPLGYGNNAEFTEYWDSEAAPSMVVITIRDANPFYDTSYSVNSENLGPWGDAIITELIPALEEQFGLLAEPWARMLAGGSTGGWESLAMQTFYPDFFGGAWVLAADGVDFNYYQIVNIYEDANAYWLDRGWIQVERPGSRGVDGNIRYMMKDENFYEIAVGDLNAMSLGQWAIWEAVYGPMGENGYPERIWDPLTGVIDHDVAEYWREHYDLNHIIQTNWAELGPKLVGKLHLRGGDMDAYYLNLSQYLLGDFLESTTEPAYEGYSVTFPRMGHTGNISNPDLLEEMRAQMLQRGPDHAAEVLSGNHSAED